VAQAWGFRVPVRDMFIFIKLLIRNICVKCALSDKWLNPL
jgi:hypothetical protein